MTAEMYLFIPSATSNSVKAEDFSCNEISFFRNGESVKGDFCYKGYRRYTDR
jgi:hypothetical protein